MTEKLKAIGLLSGGLDSRLAVKMMQDQDIEVVGLNFVTPFCNCTAKSSCKSEAKRAAEEYGIDLKVVALYEDFMEAVKAPKYGYGRGMNPCLDCRILMYKRAKAMMRELGAAFVVTGEVLGERPMSQRLDAIKIIERESGLEGLIVRPLSARLFAPTIPEKAGWVDRTRLLSISGRSRKPQMKLAAEIGVNDYPCPAGGCLLTDKAFAEKLKRLLALEDSPTKNDMALLKVGRHTWTETGAHIVIGRNELENRRLETLFTVGDWFLEADEWPGPAALIRGRMIEEKDLERAALLVAGYGKGKTSDEVAVACRQHGDPLAGKVINVQPATVAVEIG